MRKNVLDFANEMCDLYGLAPFELTEGIDDELIEEISKELGLTKDQLLAMDETAGRKYWEKYPFFDYYQEYLESLQWEAENIPYHTREEAILEVLFSDVSLDDLPNHMKEFNKRKRYDFALVKKRLIDKLKEIDEYMPGTYHKGADILDLTFETEGFTYFVFFEEMMNSFFDMVSFIKEKFFEGLQEELSPEDVLEYDFLVRYLRVYDVVNPRVILTYDNIKKYKDTYIKENYTDFFSYGKIRAFVDTEPWRCSNFFDNKDLVQKFVECFPKTKVLMRDYAVRVKNFVCEFIWSDEEEPVADKKADGPEVIRVLVPKNSEEIRGWELPIRNLQKATSPASIGGLVIPQREYEQRGISLGERLFARFKSEEGV